MNKYKKGDRVVYRGMTNSRLGKLGTVVEVPEGSNKSYSVDWDDGVRISITGLAESSLASAKQPSKHDVNDALELLKLVGKVEFTPFKPPFSPNIVVVNRSYSAVVTEEKVTIGCQVFTLDEMDKLLHSLRGAVDEALAYNK